MQLVVLKTEITVIADWYTTCLPEIIEYLMNLLSNSRRDSRLLHCDNKSAYHVKACTDHLIITRPNLHEHLPLQSRACSLRLCTVSLCENENEREAG